MKSGGIGASIKIKLSTGRSLHGCESVCITRLGLCSESKRKKGVAAGEMQLVVAPLERLLLAQCLR